MWNTSSTFLSVLLTLIVATGLTAADYYDEHGRTRYERSAATFKCTEEGYHPDPRDCRIYYRCVDWGNGGPLTTFSFTCGVGTVFSKDKGDICTHPGDSGRPECDGSTGNELDSDLRDPSESPVAPSTTVTAATRPQAITTRATPGTAWPSAGATEGATTAYQKPATTQSSPTTTDTPTAVETDNDVGCRNDGGPECTQEGFLADGCDCGRFHRCVDEGGHGGFRRYSFKCGEGTVWDPEIQACNHDWAVVRRDCKRGSAESAGGGGDNSGSWDGGQSNGDADGSSQSGPSEGQAGGDSDGQRPDSAGYPGMTDGPASSGYPGMPGGSDPSGYPGSPGAQGLPDSSGYPGQSASTAPTYPATVDSAGASSSTESPIATSPLAETSGYPTSSRRPDSATSATSVRPDSPHSPDTNKPWTGTCTEEGFFGDPQDCRKFYRCVGDGASFAKYEFRCGVGTAWDSSIQSCNHDRVVPSCGDRRPSNGTASEPDDSHTNDGADNADKPTSQAAPVNCTVAPSSAPDVAQSTTTTGATTSGPDRSTASVSYLPPASSESSTVRSTVSYPSSSTHTTTAATSYLPPSGTAATSVQRPESTTAGSVSPGGDTSATTATTSSSSSSSIASPSQDGKGECTEAGFFPDRDDCRKFYRCVEDGQSGYRKFEFQCGPGTAWDQSIQTCNHIYLVSCATDSNEIEQGSTKPAPPSQASTTGTTASSASPPASPPSSTESVTAAGTPSETTASEADKTETTTTVGGTEKPASEKPTTSSAETSSAETSSAESSSEQSTSESSEASSSTSESSETSSSTSESSEASSSTSESSETSSPASTESHGPDCTTRKPDSGAIKCDREGFHPHPTRCDKFYRCVDNGNGYNVYHFDCPPGTIFDPSISVCNYPESVYPTRDCTTAGDATASPSPSSESTSTTAESTTRATTAETERTEGTTSASTEHAATTVPSMETTASEETSKMPDDGGSTTETSATEAPATDSAPETTSAAESSTEPAATESQEPSTTELHEQSTTESQEGSTTESQEASTTESQEASTTESQEGSTTESQEGSTTESQEGSTTESQEGSTTESQEQSTTTSEPTSKPTEPCTIGNLTDDQIVLVCPTGFRRHPKHCNLFYQCTTEGTMEIKLLVLSCPDDTIFDEDKIQCLPEAKSGQACRGTKTNTRFYRRLEDSGAPTSVVKVSTDRLCPEEGHFPYRQDCSDIFYKCKRDIRDRLQGYLYKCPENFVYWSVSRRCERATRLPMCSRAVHRDNASRYDRWRIPTERLNLSARMLSLS